MARPRHPHRRLILVCCLVVLAALTAGLVARGYVDMYRPRLHRVTFPAAVSRPFSVLQASDLHIRRFGARQARLDRAIGALHADVAIITGDVIVRGDDDMGPALELVAVLRRHAPLVAFVPGNHDDALVSAVLARHGVLIVAPGQIVTVPGRPDVSIVSAGDDGVVAARPDPATPLLVVATHMPPARSALAATRGLTHGTQLVLAGHTHGGQVRVPWLGALAAPLGSTRRDPPGWNLVLFPDLRGHLVVGERHADGQWVSVSAGLGETFVPFRLFDRAELSLLTAVPE